MPDPLRAVQQPDNGLPVVVPPQDVLAPVVVEVPGTDDRPRPADDARRSGADRLGPVEQPGFIDGTQRTGQGTAGVVNPNDWVIAGIGDFDDLASTPTPTDDILWRHTSTGQTAIWLMDGTTRIGQGSPGAVAQVWQIAGVGDFDGDRRADILWRHTSTGQTLIWQIIGTQRMGFGSPGTASPAFWQIVGSGDFDGDRRHDVLWRHQITGLTFIWFIDGTDRVGDGVVGFAGMDWSVTGSGNFDGR